MRNLYEHMYVAKVVFDFWFWGQLTEPTNKNAEPLWTHVRRDGRFQVLILSPAHYVNNNNAEPVWTHVRREGRFRFIIFRQAN